MSFRGRREGQKVRMDGSSASAKPDEEKFRQSKAQSSAYSKYKEQLNELFDGKRELPKHLKDMLATRPGAEQFGFESEESGERSKAKKGTAKPEVKKSRRRVATRNSAETELLKALAATVSPLESEEAINNLRGAGFPLPEDYESLSKALSHSKEVVVLEALGALLKLTEIPQRGKNLLKGRLQNVELMFGSSAISDQCAALRQRIS